MISAFGRGSSPRESSARERIDTEMCESGLESTQGKLGTLDSYRGRSHVLNRTKA